MKDPGVVVGHVVTVYRIATASDAVRLDGVLRRVQLRKHVVAHDASCFTNIEHERHVVGVLVFILRQSRRRASWRSTSGTDGSC